MCFSDKITLSLIYFTAGVMAQDEEVVKETAPLVEAEEYIRGDMIPMTTEAPGKKTDTLHVCVLACIKMHLP